MNPNYKYYPLFADIFRYPDGDFNDKLIRCQMILDKFYPAAGEKLVPFVSYMLSKDEIDQQELYTKTFDVQPLCYLDLGYVIFGEDYKRGAFLLHMQQEQQKFENDCGSDLSDNLCNALTLIPKHDNQEFVDELATQICIPALNKMIEEFNTARVELKVKVLKKLHKAIIQEDLNQGNVYRNALEALLDVFEKDFSEIEKLKPLQLADVIDFNHHQSFFNKNSVSREVNEIINNYKID